MASTGSDFCFCNLLIFFAMESKEQFPLIPDFNVQRQFDLTDGVISTRYPLLVLTQLLHNYALSYSYDYGKKDKLTFDVDICDEIMELTSTILAYANQEFRDSEVFWARENLETRKIWTILRRICCSLVATLPPEAHKTSLQMEQLYSKC